MRWTLFRGLGCLFAASLLLSAARSAHAEEDTTHVAANRFDAGLKEMLANRFETGCPLLLDSYDADPRPGVLFTLAECYAKWGHGKDALRRYTEYLELYSRLSVDQRRAQKERATLAEAQCDALSRALRSEEASTSNPAPAVPAPVVVAPPPPIHVQRAPPREHAVRPWAIGMTVASGVIGAGAASAFLVAVSQKSVAEKSCNADFVCGTQTAVNAGNSARVLANVTTGAVIGAGVAAALAISLWTADAVETNEAKKGPEVGSVTVGADPSAMSPVSFAVSVRGTF